MDNKVSLEAMLHLAAVELDELEYYEFKELEKKNKLAEPRDEFTLKMQSVLDKEKRVDKFLKFGKKLSKVVAVFMISFSLLSMSFLSVGAVRKSVADVILEWYNGFTKIFVEDEMAPAEIGEIEFGFVPNGFKLVHVDDESTNMRKYEFINEDDKHYYAQVSISEKNNYIVADNDRLRYHHIVLDDVSGIWMEQNDYNQVVMSSNGVTYDIAGYISLSDIMKIYENIKIM